MVARVVKVLIEQVAGFLQTNIMVQVANQSLHWIEHLRAWLFRGVSRAVFNSVNSVVRRLMKQGEMGIIALQSLFGTK